MKNRIRGCVYRLNEQNCDSILISNPVNITYLTGFQETTGYLLVSKCSRPVYFTNFIYRQEAEKIKTWDIVVCRNNVSRLIAGTAKRLKLKKLGFEARCLSFTEYERIKEKLTLDGISFVPAGNVVEGLRAVKDKQELAAIRNSADITQEALEYSREIASSQASEKSLAIEIEKFLKLKGCGQTAFPVIVAAGKNTAFPHHIPGQMSIRDNFFLTDLGARSYGYCADLTRVFFSGKMPPQFLKVYDIVKIAGELALRKIKDGAKACDVDGAGRMYIEKKGFGKFFGHGIGHGVGLEVHEYPSLSPASKDTLKEGMIVTIEPAIYLTGKFGIRIENMVLVKKEKGEIISGSIHW